jgi:hypothetical protein
MADFTTTSPASGLVIKALVLVAVVAVAGLAGSYLMRDGTSDAHGAVTARAMSVPDKIVDKLQTPVTPLDKSTRNVAS